MQLNFQKSRILVIGDLMLDSYWHGLCEKISPEAPVPVLKVTDIEHRVGGAANVAKNIVDMGGNAHLLGITGMDDNHHHLTSILDASGIKHNLLQAEEMPTINKLRMISNNHQMLRTDFEQDFDKIDKSSLLELFEDIIENFDVVILSDYAKGTLSKSFTKSLISVANRYQKPTLVDPIGKDYSKYSGASLVKPNAKEIQAIIGTFATNEVLFAKTAELLYQLEIERFLVTLGAHGLVLMSRNEDPIVKPALARQVFDVTGAGDTVIAALALSLSIGMHMHDCLNIANIAAGIVVEKFGTSSASIDEINSRITG